MVWLTKKRGQIGRDCIDKMGQLLIRVLLQISKVTLKTDQPRRPDTPGNTAIDHGAFVRPQYDPGMTIS